MPRPRRVDFPGIPQHVWVRGNNRGLIFHDDVDRQLYMRYLVEACAKHTVDIHAFVLMSNHVHLLVTGNTWFCLSRAIQAADSRYASYFNRRHGRTGSLFEGRFKSSLVDTDRYFLTCMRYIELNPVRAGMVRDPAAHGWSSFSENATGQPAGLVKAHPEYLRLGADAASRSTRYLKLVDQGVTDEELHAIRENALKSRALGSESFLSGIEAVLGRKVRIVPPGRQPSEKGV
jgi:putative transposase